MQVFALAAKHQASMLCVIMQSQAGWLQRHML